MNRRLTHILVSIVAAALIVASVAFGLVATRSGRAGAGKPSARSVIPLIAHPVNDSLGSCLHCHVPGPDGTPPSHKTYGDATCLTCHEVAPAGALMTHGRDSVATHGVTRSPASQQATAPAPAATDQEPVAGPIPHVLVGPYEDCVACHAIGGNLSMPGTHSGYTNGDCTSCHTETATK